MEHSPLARVTPNKRARTMTDTAKGRDLFIVDNSASGWTGLRYLKVDPENRAVV